MNEHFLFHLETSCTHYSFSYQIIEKLPGTGYRADGTIDAEMSKVRKDKEDIWIKKLRSIFPYWLNEKARDKVNDCSMIHDDVGRSFLGFPATRNYARPERNRETRNKKDVVISCEQFFTSL